jgi:hypothetical protein
MALTEFQRTVCRLIARQRIASGRSYVAGGTALNTMTGATRLSRDVDVFHDAVQDVATSWQTDRALLEGGGFLVDATRLREGFVEAVVSRAGESVMLQWTADSAFRFFPLVEHPDFGLALHPFDLATNKVLALVGRVEARDWIDTIHCDQSIQTLGCLAWAACGKDAGFSPSSILEEAARSARYAPDEIHSLAFAGPSPDPADLSRRWHAMLGEARRIVALLPPERAGSCVLDAGGDLFRGGARELSDALVAGTIRFHPGSVRGTLPQVRRP